MNLLNKKIYFILVLIFISLFFLLIRYKCLSRTNRSE